MHVCAYCDDCYGQQQRVGKLLYVCVCVFCVSMCVDTYIHKSRPNLNAKESTAAVMWTYSSTRSLREVCLRRACEFAGRTKTSVGSALLLLNTCVDVCVCVCVCVIH